MAQIIWGKIAFGPYDMTSFDNSRGFIIHLQHCNLFIWIICFQISWILFAPLNAIDSIMQFFGICFGIKENNMSDLILFNLIQSVFKIDTCQFVTLMTMKNAMEYWMFWPIFQDKHFCLWCCQCGKTSNALALW